MHTLTPSCHPQPPCAIKTEARHPNCCPAESHRAHFLIGCPSDSPTCRYSWLPLSYACFSLFLLSVLPHPVLYAIRSTALIQSAPPVPTTRRLSLQGGTVHLTVVVQALGPDT